MVSKSEIKLITSLGQKKYRHKNRLFVVEGKKAIIEFLSSNFDLFWLFTAEDIFDASPEKTRLIGTEELKKISFLTTPQTALALFKIPKDDVFEKKGLSLVLDGIRDPGNLGAIIRLCDWFGIYNLRCSKDTVDCYNPKVVQATMGSLSRVKVAYVDLADFISENSQRFPVYGAFMEGENLYKTKLPSEAEAILVMGNEANGISPEVEKMIDKKISIPRFGELQETESLNVATATAILLSEFRRTSFTEK